MRYYKQIVTIVHIVPTIVTVSSSSLRPLELYLENHPDEKKIRNNYLYDTSSHWFQMGILFFSSVPRAVRE